MAAKDNTVLYIIIALLLVVILGIAIAVFCYFRESAKIARAKKLAAQQPNTIVRE